MTITIIVFTHSSTVHDHIIIEKGDIGVISSNDTVFDSDYDDIYETLKTQISEWHPEFDEWYEIELDRYYDNDYERTKTCFDIISIKKYKNNSK